MKKFVFISLALLAGVYLFGCGKKEANLEESQEAVSMEALTTATDNVPVAESVVGGPVVKIAVQKPEAAQTPAANLEPLPPAGPFKPAAQDIQTALKNAGFYTGEVDGRIGPRSKKAIEEFQKANNLKADGKVGLKTWAAMSKYLNSAAAPVVPNKR